MTLVTAEKVGAALGLTLPLNATQHARIESAIEDAEAKVQGYLKRPLVARTETIPGLYADEAYPLGDKRAWPNMARYLDDRYSVASYVPSPTHPGCWDVTFAVGLDVANDPELVPILTFIKQDAVASLRFDVTFTDVERAVTSQSAEGQSLSYEKASTDGTSAGSVPKLDSLKGWRRLAMGGARPAAPLTPWPYADRMV